MRALEEARAELLATGDASGLAEALELVRGVPTLAPTDTKTRERLLTALEQDIATLSQGTIAGAAETASGTAASSDPGAQYVPYGSVSTEQILVPARADIERQKTGRALRSLEKARRKLLTRSDLAGLAELIDLAQRLPVTKARHARARMRIIDAAQQNVRYLDRRRAIDAGESWSDPFASAAVKTKLPSLPPMTRREIAIAAAIVCVIVGAFTAWALVSRAPQRVKHAINCPTGDEGSPSWSPDGKRIAFAKNGSCGTQITLVSVKGGPTRELTEKYGVLPNWSPDGQTILFRSRDGFSVVTAKGGTPHLIRKDNGEMGASWSPDGKRIAFVHGLAPDPGDEGFFSTLYTMKPGGNGVHRLLGHDCNPRTPSWSPSGKYLVFACDRGVYALPAIGGSLEQLVRRNFSISPVSVSISPDAKVLAFGWNGVETKKTDENGGAATLVSANDPENATIDVAWSPSGRKLAFSVSGSGADDGLYLVDRDGSHRRLLVSF